MSIYFFFLFLIVTYFEIHQIVNFILAVYGMKEMNRWEYTVDQSKLK